MIVIAESRKTTATLQYALKFEKLISALLCSDISPQFTSARQYVPCSCPRTNSFSSAFRPKVSLCHNTKTAQDHMCLTNVTIGQVHEIFVGIMPVGVLARNDSVVLFIVTRDAGRRKRKLAVCLKACS